MYIAPLYIVLLRVSAPGRETAPGASFLGLTMASSIDISGANAKLAKAGRQAPFALALALTSLVKDAQASVTRTLAIYFDQPTPFTKGGIGILPATKDIPVAQVFVKDVQAAYLGIEETGGVRTPQPGAPVILPVQISVNTYGNIPKGALKRERAKPNTFAAPKGGALPPGIYRRAGRKLRLLAAVEPRAKYAPRFHFVETVTETVKRLAPQRLREAIAKALATAR